MPQSPYDGGNWPSRSRFVYEPDEKLILAKPKEPQMGYDFITPDTWIISDTHWGDLLMNRPSNYYELMRDAWVDKVGLNDPILHLGDLVVGDFKFWRMPLPGRKYLLKGNLDNYPDAQYEAVGYDVIGRDPFIWTSPGGVRVCFSHEPAEATKRKVYFGGSGDGIELPEWDINIHGHVHDNPYYDHIKRQEDRRNMCVELTNYAPVRLRDIL